MRQLHAFRGAHGEADFPPQVAKLLLVRALIGEIVDVIGTGPVLPAVESEWVGISGFGDGNRQSSNRRLAQLEAIAINFGIDGIAHERTSA